MKIKRSFILIGLVALFMFIQLIPVNRENPTTNKELEIKALPQIMIILKGSCYDCHSNQTNWPIYSYIAPVSWLVAHDVEEGRAELNFSEWYNLPVDRRIRKKDKIVEEVSEDKMPLPIYLFTHSDAKLTDEQKMRLKQWVNNVDD